MDEGLVIRQVTSRSPIRSMKNPDLTRMAVDRATGGVYPSEGSRRLYCSRQLGQEQCAGNLSVSFAVASGILKPALFHVEHTPAYRQ